MKQFFLTDQERERFADWLENEAESDEGMAEQVLGLPTGDMMDPLAKKLRAEALAARIVAAKLRSVERQTI